MVVIEMRVQINDILEMPIIFVILEYHNRSTSDSHVSILINYHTDRHKNVPISKNKASMF